MQCFFCDKPASFSCGCGRHSCATHTKRALSECIGCYEGRQATLKARHDHGERESWCDFCGSKAPGSFATRHCAKCGRQYCERHGQTLYHGQVDRYYYIWYRCIDHMYVPGLLGKHQHAPGCLAGLMGKTEECDVKREDNRGNVRI